MNNRQQRQPQTRNPGPSHTARLHENLVRDLRYALRSFLHAPLASLTIVVTVGLGLGLVAAVYTLLNSMVFQTDVVYQPEELYGVERQQSAIAEAEKYSLAEYEALLRETEVFTDAFASTGDIYAWFDGIRREGRLVTGNFFQVLGVTTAYGRVFTPFDDEAGSPPVIVLSHRAWTQRFDADPNVLNRDFRVNGTVFRIIGVMPEGFRGLVPFAAPDFWAPLAQAELFRQPGSSDGSNLAASLNVIGRLRSGLLPEQAGAQLNAWDRQRTTAVAAPQATSLVLQARDGTVPQGAETMLGFMPLFFAFGLILLIGCANVANLLLARFVKRQREIGIRLAIGASRSRLVWQLLTENLLLSLIASALAFAISRAALNSIEYLVTTSFPPDIGNIRIAAPAADWRVVLFLVFGAIVSTVFFALVPALRATRLDVTRTIHGEVIGNSRPSRARNLLVALQVTGSALLLICAAIFLRSAWSSANVDSGLSVDNIVNIAVLDETRRPSILDTITREPSVDTVAAAWPGAGQGLGGAPAYGEGASGRAVTSYQFVSPEYFDVLGFELSRGRFFNSSERSPNEPVAVVTASLAAELWPNANALGQVLRIEPDPSITQPIADSAPTPSDDPMLQARTAVVVGVLQDVEGFRVAGIRLAGSGVYLPGSIETEGTVLISRMGGDLETARRNLIDRFAAIDPNMVELSMLMLIANVNGYLLRTSFWITVALGVLALLLTLTGLFSVLSYLVEQRTREIGVRMALGASNSKIGRLVLWQSARPIGFGLALGVVLTVGLGAALLATPFADQIAATVSLFDPIAYAGSLACIILACVGAALVPALRAGRVNPLAALRQD